MSLATIQQPSRIGLMNRVLNVKTPIEDAAVNQIQRLGFSVSEVRHVIPTHLDIDHAEGIVDFPDALVHTSREEYAIATRPRALAERFRYKYFSPGSARWNIQDLTACEQTGEDWFGFKGVRALPDTSEEILLIPLFGHTRGHFGVAVHSESGWILHAGDAYYARRELDDDAPWDLRLFMRYAHGNNRMASYNRERLKRLRRDHPEVRVFSAHDPSEFTQ